MCVNVCMLGGIRTLLLTQEACAVPCICRHHPDRCLAQSTALLGPFLHLITRASQVGESDHDGTKALQELGYSQRDGLDNRRWSALPVLMKSQIL
ncbi:hypothetical protein FKM82_028777 [Ascaphus truei]